jgi:hypothetical protein
MDEKGPLFNEDQLLDSFLPGFLRNPAESLRNPGSEEGRRRAIQSEFNAKAQRRQDARLKQPGLAYS